jgi:hypothetical protein
LTGRAAYRMEFNDACSHILNSQCPTILLCKFTIERTFENLCRPRFRAPPAAPSECTTPTMSQKRVIIHKHTHTHHTHTCRRMRPLGACMRVRECRAWFAHLSNRVGLEGERYFLLALPAQAERIVAVRRGSLEGIIQQRLPTRIVRAWRARARTGAGQ